MILLSQSKSKNANNAKQRCIIQKMNFINVSKYKDTVHTRHRDNVVHTLFLKIICCL